jgi:hypothetical protein
MEVTKHMTDLIERPDAKAINALAEYTFSQRDKDLCFPWTDSLEKYIEGLGISSPASWIDTLILDGILCEPILGRLRFSQYGFSIQDKGDIHMEETKKQTGTSNTGTDAGVSGNIPDINELLPSGGSFSYPKLDTFLGMDEKKDAILEEIELLEGSFGKSSALKLDGNWYHSSSEAIRKQCDQLVKINKFPIRVRVAKVRGKNGRIFHTLRG